MRRSVVGCDVKESELSPLKIGVWNSGHFSTDKTIRYYDVEGDEEFCLRKIDTT